MLTRIVALLSLLAVASGCRPDHCVESAELIGPADPQRECAPGARAQVKEVAGLMSDRRMLMTCTCGPAQPDGGR